MASSKSPPSNRFRFSLKTLSVLASSVCLLLGWWSNNAKRQYHAVEFVLSKGGSIAYTFNRRPNNQPPPPEWMMHRGIRDYFFNVVGIGFLDGANIHEHDLAILRDLPNVAELTLEGQRFTDESIGQVVHLRELRYLCLWNTTISDNGLEGLASISTLEELAGFGNATTTSGIAELQKTLRNCKISL